MKSLAEKAVLFLSNKFACAVAVNPDMDSIRTQTDLISSLPDEILCNNILSRVSTKIAVRTSILSSRWRHLWKYVPSLGFCNYEKETDCGFISRSIDLYKAQKLTEFTVMTSAGKLSIPPVQKWVDFAASKGVQVLKLHIFLENGDERVFEMSPSIYSAQSLEKLCLQAINFNPPLGFRGFRNLKNLQLLHSRVSDEIVHTIVSTCELLEELRLTECYGLVKCVIATQNMNLIHLLFHVEYDEDEKFELVIDVPNLQFFSYGGMLGPISLNEFGGFASMRDIIECNSWDQFDIMKELAKVKVLELDDWFIMFLTTIHDDWGAGLSPVLPFRKLERLFWHGDVCTTNEIKLLVAFLGICPCLHEIQLNFSFGPHELSELEDENMPEVCVSSLHQLRYIGVFNYAGGTCEMKLLQLLLDKAVMLETICFTFGEPRHIKEPDEALVNALEQQVALLHRTSVHSRVLFKRGVETWSLKARGN